MLKTTYTETGCYLEYLDESLSDWLNTRYLVYLRASASIYVKQEAVASIILPRNSFYLDFLQALQAESGELCNITICDEEFLEVTLRGIWIANNEHSHEGTFVCALSRHTETSLYQIWQESQIGVSALGE